MEWEAFFIAPAGAAIQIGVGYELVKPVCASGRPLMRLLLSAAMLAVALIGVAMGW
jgi:hypothetical protein